MAYPGGAPVTIVGGTAGSSSGGPAGSTANPFVVSSGDSATTKANRSIPVTTSSQVAVPANLMRKRILIQNQDAAINVYVDLGTNAIAGVPAMRVGPGGFLDIEGTTQALNIIGSAANPNVAIWEFT